MAFRDISRHSDLGVDLAAALQVVIDFGHVVLVGELEVLGPCGPRNDTDAQNHLGAVGELLDQRVAVVVAFDLDNEPEFVSLAREGNEYLGHVLEPGRGDFTLVEEDDVASARGEPDVSQYPGRGRESAQHFVNCLEIAHVFPRGCFSFRNPQQVSLG